MTLRKRFTLFTIFWLIFILILFNIFVYFYVIKITTESEERVIANKVNLMLENPQIQSGKGLNNSDLLSEYYNVNEMIRIVQPDSKVVNITGSDPVLLGLPAAFDSQHDTGMISKGGERILYMRVPLYDGTEIVGMLEINRVLNELDNYLQILVAALTVTSAGAILFAIFGTYWFTSRLTAPIQQMVTTMREIDRSGKLRVIETTSHEESAELQQLIRAFNQMIERLDRTFEKQKQFVADASHELKTPLTVISSYANMLKRWGRDDAAVRDEAIEAIDREAKRMQNLTKSMLTLAEAEQEDWLKQEQFDVVQAIDELAGMLQTTFHRPIRIKTSSKIIRMYGDKEKIKQLFVILLDNAIKYSKDSIDVSVSQVKTIVKIEVKDRGVGIPESDLPHLFERFYRVDGARSRATGGAGLGLSIAKRIVDLHDGKVDVFSQQDIGTTITLQFKQRK
ncbi:two-component sensor histidine kinase [Paenibacillus sp. BIHB 4019]|uniref:Signal transduction histidine-protein kinase ArlS n=1 Tax=Paenibacillus sp. BIHB 4019 TaxID=1870819 RepID=A0A1B2DN80_9BACL|nr:MULTISPECIES: HAMP domain-containing histidine kinase [unclassified Paenibacillus]ANY69166.1 two-component sensor histidine kinase [Paenibacillus sp. BIHB 4019]KQO00691.1 histidine kinase [Paenibacillus sp. Leaf72]